MTTTTQTLDKTSPLTGRGSPAGPRWFVSKNPSLVLEVKPERYPDQDGNRAPHLRVPFKSEPKSELHVGQGYLGSKNPLGTDTNANRHYGVLFVMDPGPEPVEGYKDDKEPIEYQRQDGSIVAQEDWMRTAEEKKTDRMLIDHIRKVYMYKHTPQDNQYRVTSRLVELNWDPAEIRIYVGGMVIPGMGKPMARPPLSGAPEDKRPEVASPRPAPMGSVRRRVVPG